MLKSAIKAPIDNTNKYGPDKVKKVPLKITKVEFDGVAKVQVNKYKIIMTHEKNC
jgi:hypothetical protein